MQHYTVLMCVKKGSNIVLPALPHKAVYNMILCAVCMYVPVFGSAFRERWILATPLQVDEFLPHRTVTGECRSDADHITFTSKHCIPTH